MRQGKQNKGVRAGPGSEGRIPMADDNVGPAAPIVSVRPGRNRLAEEDRELLAARRERKGKHGGGEGGYGGHESAGGHGHGAIDDDVSVLGIPKEEMTENVRHAIDTLLEEINHLRSELSRAKGHEAYLEEQAEKDRMLHVMRRRAFLARLALAVRRVEEEKVEFAFLYIEIANAAAVRGEFGHGALESLMMQASAALREGAEPGDVVGSLENFDFGLILPGNTLQEGEAKAARLLSILSGRSFAWQGQSLGIQARCGDATIAAGDSADEVVQRAKDNMAARAG